MAKAFFKITLFDEINPLTELITLEANPAGILDHEIQYKKHSVYGTVFRNFGDNLRFADTGRYEDGYDYLKTIFETNGGDGNCTIKIYTIVNSNQTYELSYTGTIDFTTYNADEYYVEVGIIDNDTMAKFFAREDIEVNINDNEDLDGEVVTVAPTFEVELPTIKPVYWALGNGIESRIQATTLIPLSTITYTDYLNGATSFNNIGSDFDSSNLVYTNSLGYDVDGKLKFDMETSVFGSITITKYISVPPPDPTIGFYFTFRIYRLDTGAIYKEYSLPITSVGTFPISYNYSEIGEFISTIPNGGNQGFAFVFLITSEGGGANIEGSFSFEHETLMNSLEFELSESVQLPDTTAQMYKPMAVGESILDHMGIDAEFECLDFDIGSFQKLMMATGKGLRNYPDTPFNLSFREFFKIYNSVLGHLMYFDGDSFIFGNYDSFYDNNTSQLTIVEYSNIVISIANDKYFNSTEIGYEDNDYDYFNGNVEFNTKFGFATVNKNTANKLSKISSARADSLGIELTKRMQYEETGGEDTDGDNDIFIISAKTGTITPFVAKTGLDYTISGVRGSDSFYNYDISPKQNLTRQGFLLNSSLFYQDKVSKYISSKNDIPLVINGLAELSNNYLTANSGYIKPVYAAFDTILTSELLTFLNDTPNKMITLSGVCSGFLEEATINLYKRTANIKMVQYS